MKKLLLSLLFLPCTTLAQKILFQNERPAADANIVLMETTMVDSVVYTIAGRIFVKNGYTVDRASTEFFALATKPENRENYGFRTNLTFSVINHKIIIRGFYYGGKRKHSAFKNRNGIQSSIAFRFMDEYAQELKAALPDSKMLYAVEKVL